MTETQHFLTKLQSGEEEIFKLISRRFSPGTMIDVGAHHGIVTEIFLSQGWKSYAFEPVTENLEQIKKSLGHHSNLIIRSDAVSNESGYKKFYLALNPDNSLHDFYHSLENIGDDKYHKKGQTIQVKTVSLNDLICEQIIPKSIEFLKIDTEGHDLAVLQGSDQLVCQAISVEFWCDDHTLGASPSPPDEMISLLKERGFDKYIIIEHQDSCQTSYLYSSIKALKRNSWGNIFFFHPSQSELYADAVDLCKSFESQQQSQQTCISLIQVLNCLYTQNQELFILDVGAYRGTFTENLINHFPKSKAILFEPSPENFLFLDQKFSESNNVQVFDYAISSVDDNNTFYVLEDAATNSLLFPCNGDSKKIQVQTKTLDKFFEELQPSQRLDLIKIDTQGNDLKVIRGAQKIIKKYSPCLLLELIFTELYQSQDSYYDIFNLMRESNYSLVGFYNAHYSREGRLAFADVLFMPSAKLEQLKHYPSNQFVCYDVNYLLYQNEFLQRTCDERLLLINTLDEEARKRLDIILTLDLEVKRLQEELKIYREVN